MLAMNLLALHKLWLGFPGDTVGKESNQLPMQETQEVWVLYLGQV